MPDIHIPHLDEHDEHQQEASERPVSHRLHARSLLKILLEVVLIGTGVFLGLIGEQWRESSHRRELAENTLRRFRTEIAENSEAVGRVKDYHATTLKAVQTYLAADAKTRPTEAPHFSGLHVVFFEHTAWDLAIATQSLAYIDPKLAYSITAIYSIQQADMDMTRAVTQVMYLQPPSLNMDSFLAGVEVYYGDIVHMEPELLKRYAEVLPEIDRALGGKGSEPRP